MTLKAKRHLPFKKEWHNSISCSILFFLKVDLNYGSDLKKIIILIFTMTMKINFYEF